MRFNAPKLPAPMLGEHAGPVMDRLERPCVRSIQDPPAVAPHGHEIDIPEHVQVLRDGRLPQLKCLGNFADRPFTGRDELEDVSATRFGNGVERIRCGQGAGHVLIYTFPYGNMSRPVDDIVRRFDGPICLNASVITPGRVAVGDSIALR